MNEASFDKKEVEKSLKKIIKSQSSEKIGGGIEGEVRAILSIGTRREIEHGEINTRSLCTILGLDPTASQKVLKKNFRKIIRRYHPDILRETGVSDKEAHELGWRLTQLKEKLDI